MCIFLLPCPTIKVNENLQQANPIGTAKDVCMSRVEIKIMSHRTKAISWDDCRNQREYKNGTKKEGRHEYQPGATLALEMKSLIIVDIFSWLSTPSFSVCA